MFDEPTEMPLGIGYFFLIQSCTVWFPVWISGFITLTYAHMLKSWQLLLLGLMGMRLLWLCIMYEHIPHIYHRRCVVRQQRVQVHWVLVLGESSRCFALHKTCYRDVLVAALFQHGGQQILDSHHHQHFSMQGVKPIRMLVVTTVSMDILEMVTTVVFSTIQIHCGMDSSVVVWRLPAAHTPTCHGSSRHSVRPPLRTLNWERAQQMKAVLVLFP